jgi:chromosome segregation ATPase
MEEEKKDDYQSKFEETSNQLKEVQKEIEALRENQSNLNKGIASQRDTIKSKETEITELREKIQNLEKNPNEDKKSELSEEEIKFEKYIKDKGYMTKKEFELEEAKKTSNRHSQIQGSAIKEFLTKYPQYDSDEAWSEVDKQFALYKTPTTLDGYRDILNKIHKDIGSGIESQNAHARAKANLENNSRLSKSGGFDKGGMPDDEESKIEALKKKYPRLDEATIKSKLDEINAIYEKKGN